MKNYEKLLAECKKRNEILNLKRQPSIVFLNEVDQKKPKKHVLYELSKGNFLWCVSTNGRKEFTKNKIYEIIGQSFGINGWFSLKDNNGVLRRFSYSNRKQMWRHTIAGEVTESATIQRSLPLLGIGSYVKCIVTNGKEGFTKGLFYQVMYENYKKKWFCIYNNNGDKKYISHLSSSWVKPPKEREQQEKQEREQQEMAEPLPRLYVGNRVLCLISDYSSVTAKKSYSVVSSNEKFFTIKDNNYSDVVYSYTNKKGMWQVDESVAVVIHNLDTLRIGMFVECLIDDGSTLTFGKEYKILDVFGGFFKIRNDVYQIKKYSLKNEDNIWRIVATATNDSETTNDNETFEMFT